APLQEIGLAVAVDVPRAETVKPAAATVFVIVRARDRMKGPERGGVAPVGLPIAPRLHGVAGFARAQDFRLSVARHVDERLVLAAHIGRDLEPLPITGADVF